MNPTKRWTNIDMNFFYFCTRLTSQVVENRQLQSLRPNLSELTIQLSFSTLKSWWVDLTKILFNKNVEIALNQRFKDSVIVELLRLVTCGFNTNG